MLSIANPIYSLTMCFTKQNPHISNTINLFLLNIPKRYNSITLEHHTKWSDVLSSITSEQIDFHHPSRPATNDRFATGHDNI